MGAISGRLEMIFIRPEMVSGHLKMVPARTVNLSLSMGEADFETEMVSAATEKSGVSTAGIQASTETN